MKAVVSGAPMSVRELAREIAAVTQVPDSVELLAPRKEVTHAHCDHALARTVFAKAYAEHDVDIRTGLRRMAKYTRARPVPAPTECPAPVELHELLPPSWAARLRP